MSKSTKHQTESTVATTHDRMRKSQSALAARVVAELEAIESALHLSSSLSSTERRTLTAPSNRVTDATIEAMADTAARHDGVVAGLAFDGEAARETIARIAASATIVRAAERIAQRLRDQMLRERGAIAAAVLTRYTMLQRYTEQPEGADFRDDAETLRALMKARQAPTKRRGKSAGGSEVVAPTPATNGGATTKAA